LSKTVIQPGPEALQPVRELGPDAMESVTLRPLEPGAMWMSIRSPRGEKFGAEKVKAIVH